VIHFDDPLLVTHHGRVELTNGIGLAAYRGIITDKIHDAAMAALDDDFAQGRYRQGEVLWRATPCTSQARWSWSSNTFLRSMPANSNWRERQA
jgi:hypothetical protein